MLKGRAKKSSSFIPGMWRFPFLIQTTSACTFISMNVQADVVREVTGYARNQIYRADEVFKALDSIEN